MKPIELTPEEQKELATKPQEEIKAIQRRIQAGIPVILEDGWKYARQDRAMMDRRR